MDRRMELKRLWEWAARDLREWRRDWPEWLIVGGILLVFLLLTLLSGCATVPREGRRTQIGCRASACDWCCPNDGKVCKVWCEEKK